MTRPALQELLSPPPAVESRPVHQGLDDMADSLLRRFRAEEQGAPAATTASALDGLSQEAEDALYAWGVMCYAQRQYTDASALFGAAQRRRAISWRLSRALGVARLASRDVAGALEALAVAARLDPADAELMFCRAQAEALRARRAEAMTLLQAARTLALSTPERWPELPGWCDDLAAHLEDDSVSHP